MGEQGEQRRQRAGQKEEQRDRAEAGVEVLVGEAAEVHPVAAPLRFLVDRALERARGEAQREPHVEQQGEERDERVGRPLGGDLQSFSRDRAVEEDPGDDQLGAVSHEQDQPLVGGSPGEYRVEQRRHHERGQRAGPAAGEMETGRERRVRQYDDADLPVLVHRHAAAVREVEGRDGRVAEEPTHGRVTQLVDQHDEIGEDEAQERNQEDDEGGRAAPGERLPAAGLDLTHAVFRIVHAEHLPHPGKS